MLVVISVVIAVDAVMFYFVLWVSAAAITAMFI